MRVGALAAILLIAPPAMSAEPLRIALLVGVGSYPKLGTSEQLRGTSNDIDAMHDLLTTRFGFDSKNVARLRDEQATGAGIRAAWDRLAQRIEMLPKGDPPATVVFHFSGHGSQVPDQPPGHPDHDEDDGLDETLVPHDATRQGGDEDIRDDELYRFLERLCSGGRAQVWVVLDCCHSGTGARGATRVRQLDRQLRAVPPINAPPPAKRLPTGAVVLSACRAREVEPEYLEGDTHYGLMTRFLVQVLTERPNVSSLTYDLLRDAIRSRYQQDPAVIQPPIPQIEGDGAMLRGSILGIGPQADRPAYWSVAILGEDRGRVRFRAGAFHGLTVGSLYQVYERPEDVRNQQDDIGYWVRIESVEGTTARGKVFTWDGENQADSVLPPKFQTGTAIERVRAIGDFAIRVRVVRAGQDGDGPPLTELPTRVAAAFQMKPDEGKWIVWAKGESAFDLLLRIDGNQAALFPMTGLPEVTPDPASKVPASLRGGWGPINLDEDKASSQLREMLHRVTRGRNLLRLMERNRAATDGPTLEVELVAVDVSDEGLVTNPRPWKRDAEGQIMVREGEKYAFRVHNRDSSDKPWFVTLLHIDANMGIDQILPYQEGGEVTGEQKLEKGQSRLTDAFEVSGGHGPRRLIVIGTREPNDFYMLAQPSLPQARGVPPGQSEFDGLLLEQTYFRTRGGIKRVQVKKEVDDSWASTTLTFFARE